MKPIFISYRRSDLSLEAEWIYNFICTFFGPDIVFFDKEEIESGKRWDSTLRANISEANIVLILIGPKWLHEQLESGKRRLDDPEDWVRNEVVASIESYKSKPDRTWVYPVLLNDAKLPKREWLPIELEELALFQIEKALIFNIKNYTEAACHLHAFIADTLLKLKRNGLLNEYKTTALNAAFIPNPYELTGYQLPLELRTSRPLLPFKGLEYFKREDARVFFGRQTEIGEIIDHFKKSQHLLRFYGQSGVGKSSLLFAGLIPRMESKGWIIKYFRRKDNIPMGKSLQSLINELEKFDESDILIILDQVEEIITNPNPRFARTELEELSNVIVTLKQFNIQRSKKIRLILSYRKEYDVNIKSALQDKGIYSNEYWLKDLSKPGMREAIIGVTKDFDLNNAYHIQIEKGLDDLIINDLLNKENNTDATPLLQVLLRKMWDRISSFDIDKRIVTRELYEKCKSHDLAEFLKDRLQTIAEEMSFSELKYGVESGLALDVLEKFTTEHDTASSLKEEDILQLYDDITIVRRLLQAFVDTYLLARNKCDYRLPHDTLAKTIRLQYTISQLPGQRAAILITSKKHEIETNKPVEFSKTDLSLIEEGIKGMKKLSEAEWKVITQSREKIAKHELELEEKNKQLEMALAEAKEQTLQAKAKAMAANAREILQSNTTLAIRLAEAAMQLTSEPTKESRSAFFDILKLHQATFLTAFNFQHNIEIYSATFSPDGNYILIGSFLSTARLWDLNGRTIQVFEGHSKSIYAVAFSPDGKRILTGSMDRTARLWNLNGDTIHIFEGHSKPIYSVAFSPDGRSILTASGDNTARLWDLNGQTIQVFEGHTGKINSISFFPDGKYILSGSDDTSVRLWDLDGKTIQVFEGHSGKVNSVSIARNVDYILSGSEDKSARVWDLDGKTISINKCHDEGISSVSFSPDDKYILTGSGDKTARLSDLEGNTIQIFDQHSKKIHSVGFSRDGRCILTAGFDSNLMLWNIYWEILDPYHVAIPTLEQMKQYDIPENIVWGKKW